jgi:hypothetical protein
MAKVSMADEPATESMEEMREYVEAFRTSSNRARFALYVLIVATVLIGITNRNGHRGGWPLRRIDAWYGSPVSAGTPFFGGDTVLLKIVREEYVKQFTGRTVLTSSPILGFSIDVNDLGLIGGITLVLLMLVLVLCLLREHENLYLALFKVRLLCSEEGAESQMGNSRANLLYHSLAMSQVISSPPTLARWRRWKILRYVSDAVFFAPFFVHAWVVWKNWGTREIAALYGAEVTSSLVYQAGLGIMILLLSTVASTYSRAIAKRWESAFRRVNPGRKLIPPMRLWEWMKLPSWRRPSRTNEDELRPRLMTALVDTLTVAEVGIPGETEIDHKISVGSQISRKEMKEMTDALFKAGTMKAKAWCSAHQSTFNRLLKFTTNRNEVVGHEWFVSGTWRFLYFRDTPSAPVRPTDDVVVHQSESLP